MPRALGELAICEDLVSILGRHLADHVRDVLRDRDITFTTPPTVPDPETGYVIDDQSMAADGRPNSIQIWAQTQETPTQWRSPAGPVRVSVEALVRWHVAHPEQTEIGRVRMVAAAALRQCVESWWREESTASAWISGIVTRYNVTADQEAGNLVRQIKGLPPADPIRPILCTIRFVQFQPGTPR